MIIPKEFAMMEKALRSLGRNGRMGFYRSDLVMGDRFLVALDCPGVIGGEVRGVADTLENAFYQATVRLDDAQKQAA